MKQQPEQSKRPETGQISAKLECLEREQKNSAATHEPERERRKNKHQRCPNTPKPTPNALPPAPAQRHASQRARATPHPNPCKKNLMQNEATGKKKKKRPLSFDLETQLTHTALTR
jgi:hypothetical protein